MAQLTAAIAFLTRLPIAPHTEFRALDVARAHCWFPLIGALIGAVYAAALQLFAPLVPPLVRATLILAIEALLTGALHLDGLADTADGFGGGRTREDTLRIMRDHATGSYGAVALIVVALLKVAAVAALIERHRAMVYLILAPALGRWAAVLLSAALPYARSQAETAVTDFVGHRELLISTATALVLAIALANWRGAAACVLVIGVSVCWGAVCRRRIGGVTGDTLGAGIEISETLVLLFAIAVP